MKIENLRSEKNGKRAKVCATVSWEDCDRPTHEVYFETVEEFADGLSCNPHSFLVGCIIPAMHYGEKRIWMDAEICPELRSGLVTAMSLLRHWHYGPERELVRIETKTRSGLSTPRTSERAGFFFSGGIDSLATLRHNRLNYPMEHPWSIKDGLLVYGLEVDDLESFKHVVNSMSVVAQDANITMIPVYTNLYLEYRQEDATKNYSFWIYEFQGAVFAAIAHAFSQRFSVVSIAATYDIAHLGVWGSHPLLDPNYSSIDLRIRHDCIELSRFAKTKLIDDWDVALQHIRVCNHFARYRSGMLNCGECEKCVRTMLALLALGKLYKTRAFPIQNVSKDLVLKAPSIRTDYIESCYRQLLNPLLEIGRHDLVRAIEQKIAEYHRSKKINNWKAKVNNWKAKVKRLDSKYLNDSIVRWRRSVIHKRANLKAAGTR